MEPCKEPISVRIARLNNLFLSKTTASTAIINKHWVSREGLLDALTVLYDECNNDSLKRDKNIANFVDKFRSIVTELRRLRVNITDFEVKKVIGRGHFGEVHVVREKQTGDVYAMKKMRKSDTLSQQSVAFYEEERDIMACAASPWLTSLQYAFQDLSHLYLVMEFHPGGDLLALLERFDGHLSEDMARFYLAELVLSIHNLHSMRYVHRDIKPDNILIDRCGHLKLADFGSAAKLNDAGIVLSEMPVGTPEYISPEVLSSMESTAKGKNRKGAYGVECDYWSLGIVAYEMAYGHTPFSGDRLMSTYCNIMNHKETLIFPENEEVSENFRNLVVGLLKASEDRLGHEMLLQHKFFSSIDWNGIRETVPPFVPVVNGQDDTSNFVEFDHEAPTPSIANFKIKREFSGQNLPFIGFTYAPEVTTSSSPPETSASPKRTIVDTDQLLAAKQKVIQELQIKLRNSESMDRNKEMEAMEKRLEEKSKKIQKLKEDKNNLEDDLAKYISEIMVLKRLIETEKTERLEMEGKTIELVKDAKHKWKRHEEEKVMRLAKKIEVKNLALTEANEKIRELSQLAKKKCEEVESMESSLKSLKKTVSNYKIKMAKAQESRRNSVAGVENRLEQLTIDGKRQIDELQASLEDERKRRVELEKALRDAEAAAKEQQRAWSEQSKNHKTKMENLESELSRVRNELEQANKGQNNLKVESKLHDEQIRMLESSLRKEKNVCHELRGELQRLGDSLLAQERESLSSQASHMERLLLDKSATVNQLEVELKEAETEKLNLKHKMTEAENREREHKDQVLTLEAMFSRLEGIVSALTEENAKLKDFDKVDCRVLDDEQKTILQHENHLLNAQLKKLEAQLDKMKEQSVLEKQATKAAQTDLWKKEKELSDVKLDLRITTRELKTAEEQLKSLQAENKNINDRLILEKKEQMEKIKLKCEEIACLEKEICQLKEKLELVESEFASFKESASNEKNSLEEKVQSLNLAVSKASAVSQNLDASQNMCKDLEAQIKRLEKSERELNERVFNAESLVKSSQADLDGAKRNIEALELNSSLLRQACVEMEEQLEDYQKLVSAHETKELLFEGEKKGLLGQLEKESKECARWKRSYEQEELKRAELEHKLEELTQDAEERDGEVSEEIQSLKTKCAGYKSLAEQLTEQVNDLQEQLGDMSAEVKTMKRREEAVRGETIQLKEETTQYLTQIHSLRDSNFKLTSDLEEALSNCKALRIRVDECGADMAELRALYQQREVKMEATIKQQAKLIDFLQSMTQGKKKKTLSDRLFGNSNSHSANTQMPGPNAHVRLQELEAKLSMERAKNKRLMDDFMRAKTELSSIQENMHQGSDQVISQLVQSPCAAQTPSRKPSLQRMHHKIPHRFEMKMNMRPAKCAACLDSVHFGRYAAICEECSMIAHPKCSLLLPNTCGLPTQFVRHFSETWKNGLESTRDSIKESQLPSSHPKMEGWVKLLKKGKSCWERKYLRLEDEGRVLRVYDHQPNGSLSPVQELELCSPDGEVAIVLGAVPLSEVVNTAKSDIPYILKVEVDSGTTCWPGGSSLLIMALSFPEKQAWVTALESAVAALRTLNPLGGGKAPAHHYHGEVITKLSGEKFLSLNCCLQMNKDLLLLGAEEGLFSLRLSNSKSVKNQPTKIAGITCVYQVALLNPLGIAVMIAGESRLLMKIDLRQLQVAAEAAECSRPVISPRALKGEIESCHLFSARVANPHDHSAPAVLCAASSDKIVIMKWDANENEFAISKILETAEPCSCLHFAPHSVIVGCDKFFEVDLKDFSVEEFLDASDTTLAYAVLGTHQLNSFPVAVLDISNCATSPEYLLCFHEFAVFVDPYGRRTREADVKWNHISFAFAFQKPYLFIFHFAMVEILKITHKSFTLTVKNDPKSVIYPEKTVLEFPNPQLLGTSTLPETIFLSTCSDIKVGNLLRLQGSLACPSIEDGSMTSLDTLAFQSEDGDGDSSDQMNESEFSFTSSIVQSLDDPEENVGPRGANSGRSGTHRVQFEKETNL